MDNIGKIKSSKIINNIIKKFGEKKNHSYFKILSCKGTISSNAKIVPTYKNKISNISKNRGPIHSTLVKSSSASLNKNNGQGMFNSNKEKNYKFDEEKNNKIQEVKEFKEKGSKSKDKINNDINLSKFYHKINDEIDNEYKFYTSKKQKNNLPNIISPQRLNYSKQQFSLNDIDNFGILPIVLPQIGKIQKHKNLKNLKKKSGNLDK